LCHLTNSVKACNSVNALHEAQATGQAGWLEFNIPFQHKYGYIRDETGQAQH